MAARRAERLVNLVICLLSTRQFLTAERIRDAVPGYEAADGSRATDEAFKRMFERDKAELRDLGIPLETGRNSHFDTEDGYRIKRRDYELPADRVRPGRSGRGRPRRAAVAVRDARRAGPRRPDQAAGRRHGCAAGGRPGALPDLDASDPACPHCSTRPAHAESAISTTSSPACGIRAAPHARTMGCAVLAAAVVRRGARSRPRRGAQLPAVSHRGRGRVSRPHPARSSGPRTSTCSAWWRAARPDSHAGRSGAGQRTGRWAAAPHRRQASGTAS